MAKEWDAIVVGARCAGSPAAMLLARKGYNVLLVDRATFPSDTLSTHMLHPRAIASLARWGLLDRVTATGAPEIERYAFDFGPVVISGRTAAVDGIASAYGPRRTVLDKILVDAAAEAGAEVREGFAFEELLDGDGRVAGLRGHDHDGKEITERARVVVGADGRNSRVAKAVRPEQYNEKPRLAALYYSYWSGLPTGGFETIIRPERGWAAWPTNDDLTLLVVGWPYAEFDANRHDVEGNVLKTLELEPSFAERVRAAKREEPFAGGSVPGFFRKPYGPGWALVGDAGYNKDPITAQGITDAFRDAELCATALDEAFTGARSFEDAMFDYQTARDEDVGPMYEFTAQLASLEPPPEEMQHLLGAMAGNQQAMDGFVSAYAGSISPAEFFAEENVGRIMSAGSAA